MPFHFISLQFKTLLQNLSFSES